MVGKKITKTHELDNGYTVIYFDDGTFIIVKIAVESEDLDLPEADNEDDNDADDDTADDSDEDDDSDDDEDDDSDDKDDDDKDDDSADEWFTWEELEAMKRDDLEEVITDEELKIDPEEFKSTKKLRKAIAEALDVEIDA